MDTKMIADKLLEHGISLLPIRTDGSKAPVSSWKQYQKRLPTPKELEDWFGNDSAIGIAVVCGRISGNLEILDFDYDAEATFCRWADQVEEEAPDLLTNLTVVQSPKGYHVYYRCAEIAGNQKLASIKTDSRTETLIETRGEGGYVLTPGCPPQCHPLLKTYEFKLGTIETIPTITPDEREILHSAARRQNKLPEAKKGAPEATGGCSGKDFKVKASWSEILKPHGWELESEQAGKGHWRKPNKSGAGISATTNHGGRDCLYVFSTNAEPFEAEVGYSKLEAYALLNHDGDLSEAAQELVEKGWGQPLSTGSIDYANEDSWEDPIPLGDSALPALEPDFLPDPIRDYVRAVVANTQTPVDMATLTALVVLATASQKQFKVHVDSAYSEPLSLYAMVLLPPASRKTAVQALLTEPLKQWEADKAKQLAPQIQAQEDENFIREKRIDDLRKQAAQKKDPLERSALMDELYLERQSVRPVPHVPSLFVTDTTPEAFVDLLEVNQERAAIISDEGAIIDIMTGLYSDGKANLDVFLKGHAGGPVRVIRKNKNTDLDDIAVTIGLCVQPEVITGVKASAKKTIRGKGLLGRMLYAYPQHNLGKRKIRQRVDIPASGKTRYQAVVNKILDLKMPLPDAGARPILLSADAHELWLDFSDNIEKELADKGRFSEIRDWAGKLTGAALRIAGLVEVAQAAEANALHGQIEISHEVMANVIDFCWSLAIHAKAVLGSLDQPASINDAKSILGSLNDLVETDPSGARFVKRSKVQRVSKFSHWSAQRIDSAFSILHDRNITSAVVKVAKDNARPSYLYFVNPIWLQTNDSQGTTD